MTKLLIEVEIGIANSRECYGCVYSGNGYCAVFRKHLGALSALRLPVCIEAEKRAKERG